MDGNPYARMLSVIRSESTDEAEHRGGTQGGLGVLPCRMRLGKVTQRSPLKVSVAGLEQPTEALRINERLTADAEWKVTITSPDSDYNALSGTLSGPVSCGGDGCAPQLGTVTGGQLHSENTRIGSKTDPAVTKQIEIDLDVGDLVLLLTEDDQLFFIVMKVVNAV